MERKGITHNDFSLYFALEKCPSLKKYAFQGIVGAHFIVYNTWDS